MTRLRLSGLFVFALLTGACTVPGAGTAVSKNHNSRVSIIVIHHTTADYADSYRVLTEPSGSSVSSHYLIPEPSDPTYKNRKLQTEQLVPESRRAWHAGSSYWSEKTGLNDQSIGIELVNQTYCHRRSMPVDIPPTDNDKICFYPDFADSQIELLTDLLADILQRHPDIKPTNIIGHADIAPDRKIDPGPRFPWQRLYVLGFGAWYDDATVIKYWERFRVQPLPLNNIQRALNAYGYRIEVSGEDDQQSRNAFRAFQMHFRPSRVSGSTGAESAAVLFALIEKYHPDKLEELLRFEETPSFGPLPHNDLPAGQEDSDADFPKI